MTSVELPFRAEYAKSGRAACKQCKEKIEKDHLRLAVMVQSPMFDGKVPNWYHFTCFFAKKRLRNVGDISHFESLRWEDQEKIRNQIDSSAEGSTSSENRVSSKATKRKSAKSETSGEFRVEYAKSSRSVCRACEHKIIKNDLRACIVDYESEEGRQYGGVPLWHHLDCFAKVRQELGFWNSGEKLAHFNALTTEDQQKIKAALPEIKPVKKEEPDEEPAKKFKKQDSSILKIQNKKMFKYRDLLKTLKKNDLVQLLTKNKQDIPVGSETMLDRLADGMTFGALEPCPSCKKGQLVFRSGVGYYCLGQDEWAKCDSVLEDPARKTFLVPKALKEKYEFLEKYKCKIEKRVFEKNVPSASIVAKSTLTSAKSMKSEPGKSGPKIERNLPCRRMEFFIAGKLSRDKKDIKHEIEKLGGTLGSSIHSMTTAIISTEEMVKKKGVHIKNAKKHNIQIVPESFLAECEKGTDAVATINRLNLTAWGSDPSTRLSAAPVAPVAKSTSINSRYKSCASTVKLTIHGGVAVDPQSEKESIAHVYRDLRGNVYNASLSLTDLQSGKNSYYKIQVLESNAEHCAKRYWLFRSWGRIGTIIGGCKTDNMTREEAIDMFKQVFYERTENDWENRKNFVKRPGKMVMVDVTYDDDEVDSGIVDIPSKLEKPVQEIVKLIFNIDLMNTVMKEMELDLEKMPLGKLSKEQIQKAFKVLTRLQECLIKQEEKVDEKTVIICTNQFFSLIPHDFGIDNPPLLNDLEMIKQKTEMLDSLMEIEIAYSLYRKSDEGEGPLSKLDSHYRKLKAELRPMSATEAEFDMLKLYLQNTHAETHKNYELEIVEVFKVERHGEDERFTPFKKLHNRKLLWHGSRLTNFAGILSQGLRIAPPEAPVTGYMFGKGIYFADMVSKSANYCMANPSNNTGLLLLCEVALGDMHELFSAENIVKPPKGKHSVKGIGKTEPDPKMTKVLDDGVEIPLGRGVPSSPHGETSLLYNEYIVYDVAQVKVRYLVQVKFNFTY